MSVENTMQLSLPYMQIEKVCSRDFIRKVMVKDMGAKHGSRDSYFFPVEMIQERENFNTRYDYGDLEQLAKLIINTNGLLEPLHVDITPDRKIFVERGHRRLRAIKLILDGKVSGVEYDPLNFKMVECFVNNKKITEEDRTINIWGSNMGSRHLKPMEQAPIAFRLKYCFSEKPLSNEKVAEKMGGISRQKVDYLITLAEQPDDIKDIIRRQDMTIETALAFIKSQIKIKKEDAAGKKEIENRKTSTSPTPLPVDNLAKDIAELKDLDEKADQILQKENEDKEEEKLSDSNHYIQVPEDGAENLVPKENVDGKPPVVIDTTNKTKYDMNREEIQKCQRMIGNLDKLEAITSKLDIPEGSKKDISQLVAWIQNDMQEIREYVHVNNKLNKKNY